MTTALAALAVVTVALIAVLVLRPGATAGRAGKVLAFVALFVLPLVLTSLGAAAHLEQSKSTQFCLSCHVMEPYGRSLSVDGGEHLPATHYQNNWTPREDACYTCHTTYTMYGDFRAKLQGLKHLYVYYSGQTPETIELYAPYQNRECLSCHGASRAFREDELHAEMLAELTAEETSCLECHDLAHDVASLDELDFWQEGGE